MIIRIRTDHPRNAAIRILLSVPTLQHGITNSQRTGKLRMYVSARRRRKRPDAVHEEQAARMGS